MPARTAIHPGSANPRRSKRTAPAHAQRRGPVPRAADPFEPDANSSAELPGDAGEQFRVASRDRLIPRPRDGQQTPPRISFEVLLALVIVVACMCGALAVGAAFTLQV